MRRRLVQVLSTVLVGAALGSVACSVRVSGTGSAAGTISSTATPSPVSGSEWVTGEDPASGISFALPGKAKTQTRPGNDGTPRGKRVYYYDVNDDFHLSVSVIDGSMAEEDLDVVPDQLLEQMNAAGVTDAKVDKRERAMVEGHPALDFQFSFNAKNGHHNFWLTRQIAADRHVVLLQSIGFTHFVDKGFENFVRDHHRQLLAGLKLA